MTFHYLGKAGHSGFETVEDRLGLLFERDLYEDADRRAKLQRIQKRRSPQDHAGLFERANPGEARRRGEI